MKRFERFFPILAHSTTPKNGLKDLERNSKSLSPHFDFYTPLILRIRERVESESAHGPFSRFGGDVPRYRENREGLWILEDRIVFPRGIVFFSKSLDPLRKQRVGWILFLEKVIHILDLQDILHRASRQEMIEIFSRTLGIRRDVAIISMC